MNNSITARGLKRTADESFLNEDGPLDTDITDTNSSTAAATNNAAAINDASAAIMHQDDETKIQDALEAWEEMGDLSRHIAQKVLVNVRDHLHKFRRMLIDDDNNDNTSGDNVDYSATPSTAAAAASISSNSNTSSSSSCNTRKKAALFDMIQRAHRLNRCIFLFCYHHERLKQELDDLLEKIRSTDKEEDGAVAAAQAPCE